MARKHKPSTTLDRRVYADEFKREAVAMLLDGHSASSIAQRLGIAGTNLLYRWKKQQVESVGPVGEGWLSSSRVLFCDTRKSIGDWLIGRATDNKHKTGHRHAARSENAQRKTDRSGRPRFNDVSITKTSEQLVNFHG